MSEKECHGIMEVKTYIDEQGREVTQFTKVFGKEKESPVRYRGTARLVIQSVHPVTGQTAHKNMDLTFNFPEGIGLKRAFETFDKHSDDAVNTWKNEQEKRAQEARDKARVATASSIPPMSIVGPDGRKI